MTGSFTQSPNATSICINPGAGRYGNYVLQYANTFCRVFYDTDKDHIVLMNYIEVYGNVKYGIALQCFKRHIRSF